MSHDPLLQPFQLKHLTLRNRIMTTSHEPAYPEDGMPKARYRAYHAERAKAGVALAMTASSIAALVQYALLRPFPSLFEQSLPIWRLSLLNATLCTVLPVFLTMMAVARIGAGTAAQTGMVGPVSTLFLGAWLPSAPGLPGQLLMMVKPLTKMR